ncbi:MAG: sigma-70 family RNA polymerase sigma factor [Planctomycetota bacterium]
MITMTLPHEAMPTTESTSSAATRDAEALRAWCEHGDREELGALFARWQRPAYAVALRLTNNSSDAEDAVQQGFLAAMRRARQWSGRGSAGSWLLAIVANQARDLRRARDQRTRWQMPLSEVPASPQPEDNDELRATVRRAVDELPEHERVPLVLHHIDGLDQDAVAAALGRNPGTVRMQLSRALERLHTILSARGVTAGAALSVLVTAMPAAEPPATLVTRITTATNTGPIAATGIASWWIGVAATVTLVGGMAWWQIQTTTRASQPMSAVAGNPPPEQKPEDWWSAASWDKGGPENELLPAQAFPIAGRLTASDGATFSLRIGSADNFDASKIAAMFAIRQQRDFPVFGCGPAFDSGKTFTDLVAGIGLSGPRVDRGTWVFLASENLNSREWLVPYRLQRDGNTFTLVLDEWRDSGGWDRNIPWRHAQAINLLDLAEGTYHLRVLIRHFHCPGDPLPFGNGTYAPIALDHTELTFTVGANAPPVTLPPKALTHADPGIIGATRGSRLPPLVASCQVSPLADRPAALAVNTRTGPIDWAVLKQGQEPAPLNADQPEGEWAIHCPVLLGGTCTLRGLGYQIDDGTLTAWVDVWYPDGTTTIPVNPTVTMLALPTELARRAKKVDVYWYQATANINPAKRSRNGTWSNAISSYGGDASPAGWRMLFDPKQDISPQQPLPVDTAKDQPPTTF